MNQAPLTAKRCASEWVCILRLPQDPQTPFLLVRYHYALDISRKATLMSEELADVEDPSLDPEAQGQQEQMRFLLREMVGALPAAYRDVCEMRYGQDLSTAETAHRLGISRSNVSTRLERAVRVLMSRLDARLRK